MRDISRRAALLGTMAGGLAGCATSLKSEGFVAQRAPANATFAHGVASGDPDRESVVLWTRVSTESPIVAVTVEVSADAEFAVVVKRTTVETSAARDHTVKYVAHGLTPGQVYFYRFESGGTFSAVGRTKTLPETAEQARFAVCSCSNYPFGYFNAYDHMARRSDLDAVIHLGDYLYEYSDQGYGAEDGARLGRAHQPAHEITKLDDYRQRHAQYKSDPSAQAMHGALPMICIWDDHETANDSWVGGAQNHSPDSEGTWAERTRVALQAYYEWMPVRDPEPGQSKKALYREYNWGGLLTLMSIETRLTARHEPLDYADIVPMLKTPADIEAFQRDVLNDPARKLLGPDQMSYLSTALSGSVRRGEPWRMVANQIIMARIIAPNLDGMISEERITEIEQQWSGIRAFIQFSMLGLPTNMDAWDGYPQARQSFYEMAQAAGARDLIVLTGDTHEAWGNDLYDDADQRMGVEIATTAVTSPGSRRYLGDGAADYSLLLRRDNRDIRFHDSASHGYTVVSFDGDQGQADYVALSTIESPTYDAAVTARFDLVKKNGTVEFANPRGLGFKERFVF